MRIQFPKIGKGGGGGGVQLFLKKYANVRYHICYWRPHIVIKILDLVHVHNCATQDPCFVCIFSVCGRCRMKCACLWLVQSYVDVKFIFCDETTSQMEFIAVPHFKELRCVGFIHQWKTFNEEPTENHIEITKYEGWITCVGWTQDDSGYQMVLKIFKLW